MKIKRLISIIMLLIMLLSLMFNVTASNDFGKKKIVKIAAFNTLNMQEKNEAGEYFGYSYDYLNALLPYTNWEYEYVEGSAAECMEWLKNGEIDIMGCLVKTPDREEIYDFVDCYTGFNSTKLIVKNDNTKYAANDYETFNGMVIGVQKSTSHINQLTTLMEEKQIKLDVKIFDTEEEVLTALKNNVIDSACVSSLKIEEWTRVIATFDIHPFFYAVTKGNDELLKELNNAIGEMKNDNPTLEESLRRKYHVNESKNSVVFSNKEKEYMAKAGVLKLAYDSNFMPIDGKSKKTNKPVGYTAEVLNKISQMTGLQFEYITGNNYKELLQLMKDGKIDILSSFNKSLLDVPQSRTSDSYLNLNVVLMGKTNFYLNDHDEVIVAVPLRAEEFVTGIQKVYPNCKFLFFDSGSEAYRAVANDQAHLAIRNIYSAQLDIATIYSDFRIIYDLNQATHSMFLFSEDSPEELVSIFNKCIASFTEAEVNTMMMNATIEQIDTDAQTIRVFIISLVAISLAIFAIWLIMHLVKARRSLVYAAFYDELTGLPNLNKFKKEAKKLLQEHTHQSYAILITDIADFSFINEKYGFDVGDLVIKSVAKTLAQVKSATTLTARISSNMFVNLYVYNEKEEESLTKNPLLHTFQYKDNSIQFFHYYGRYLIPQGETDVNSIYEKAIYSHLFAKKNSIKSRIVDYDHEAKTISLRNQEIESKMNDALVNRDFNVYLQPKYRCDGTTLVGAEALVRWIDSSSGEMIFPNDFIPLFERNGFITKLDLYMFEEVCRLLSSWKNSNLDLVTISVNFSRLHFSNPNMADTLFEITKKYDVDTKYLEIEITENALSTEISEISVMIKKLNSYGFKISLDDFSSQNSSLLFLAEVPVDVVKLDKAFVSGISENEVSCLLVDGTTKILKELNFIVVAEGVESLEQVKLLDAMKCDIIQGYIFSRPIPANDITKLLNTSKV